MDSTFKYATIIGQNALGAIFSLPFPSLPFPRQSSFQMPGVTLKHIFFRMVSSLYSSTGRYVLTEALHQALDV